MALLREEAHEHTLVVVTMLESEHHGLAPHYDLTTGRREKAITLGAVFVPAREQVLRRRAAGQQARIGGGGAERG